jgi:hypothetical protein
LADLNQIFSKIATWISHQAGRAYTFVLAVAVVALWAVSGPLFGFSLNRCGNGPGPGAAGVGSGCSPGWMV